MDKLGKSLFTPTLALLLVLAASAALACGGGGGGGGGGGSSFNKMFEGGFSGNSAPPDGIASGTMSLGPPPKDKYGETGDWGISHQTWGKIYGGLETGAKVADTVGSIVSIFIPGTGAYKAIKIIHTVGKGYAVTQDTDKQKFIGKVLTGTGKAIGDAFGTKDPNAGRSPGFPQIPSRQWGRALP